MRRIEKSLNHTRIDPNRETINTQNTARGKGQAIYAVGKMKMTTSLAAVNFVITSMYVYASMRVN